MKPKKAPPICAKCPPVFSLGNWNKSITINTKVMCHNFTFPNSNKRIFINGEYETVANNIAMTEAEAPTKAVFTFARAGKNI